MTADYYVYTFDADFAQYEQRAISLGFVLIPQRVPTEPLLNLVNYFRDEESLVDALVEAVPRHLEAHVAFPGNSAVRGVVVDVALEWRPLPFSDHVLAEYRPSMIRGLRELEIENIRTVYARESYREAAARKLVQPSDYFMLRRIEAAHEIATNGPRIGRTRVDLGYDEEERS